MGEKPEIDATLPSTGHSKKRYSGIKIQLTVRQAGSLHLSKSNLQIHIEKKTHFHSLDVESNTS